MDDRTRQYYDRKKSRQGYTEAHKRATYTYRKKHPERFKANMKVTVALRNGTLKREPCQKCGSTENIQSHHEDYSKPLEVTWLCRKCHLDHHGRDGSFSIVEYRKKFTKKQREKYQTDPEFRRVSKERALKWCKDNPERHAAAQRVQYAIQKGRLTRGPCSVCGVSKGRMYMWFPNSDYRRHLDVVWFCLIHRKRHKKK